MKKLLLATAFILSALAVDRSYAQCTPDAGFNDMGISPTTLPNACINEAYDETITFNFPNDTCIVIVIPPCTNLNVDSVDITSITNTPPGMGYVCPSGNCRYYPDPGPTTKSCFQITGTPTVADTFDVTINVTAYFGAFQFPQAYPATVVVNPNGVGGCSVTGTDASASVSLSAAPNPTTGAVSLSVAVTGVVTDILGNELDRVSGSSVDLSGYPSGIYILSTDQGTIRLRKE